MSRHRHMSLRRCRRCRRCRDIGADLGRYRRCRETVFEIEIGESLPGQVSQLAPEYWPAGPLLSPAGALLAPACLGLKRDPAGQAEREEQTV